MHKTIEKKDIIIALASTALLSLNVVTSKIGVDHFPPFLFAALRFLTCAPFLYFFPIRDISMKDLLLISLCIGFLYLGGINFALYSGVSAGITILFAQLSVFITILLSAVFLKDIPKFNQLAGIFVGFIGIFVICLVKGFAANTLGMLALFISAFAYAVGTLLVKRANSNPFALNIWVASISVLPTLFISLLFEGNILETLSSTTLSQWGTVLFAGLGSMLLAGAGWTYLVNKYTLSSISPFRLLTPVFGIIFAVIILRESYPLAMWIGASLVMGGLVITQLKFPYSSMNIRLRRKMSLQRHVLILKRKP